MQHKLTDIGVKYLPLLMLKKIVGSWTWSIVMKTIPCSNSRKKGKNQDIKIHSKELKSVI